MVTNTWNIIKEIRFKNYGSNRERKSLWEGGKFAMG